MDSINRIKPGIAEATRAVLRRVPDHVFLFARWMTRMFLFWLGWQKRKVSGDGSRGYARSVSCGYHYQKGTLMKKTTHPMGTRCHAIYACHTQGYR
uniref:Putative ATP/GTP-binding protein n=1 Tax=Klebsiella pneumoniae TaxID=573 RepID=A0A8B0SRU6_KLEPN|nr:putative ATP/GTP-binding protein [Klebsiella pneumoniae]